MNIITRKKRDERVCELARQGLTYEMIGRKTNLSTVTVWRILKNNGLCRPISR